MFDEKIGKKTLLARSILDARHTSQTLLLSPELNVVPKALKFKLKEHFKTHEHQMKLGAWRQKSEGLTPTTNKVSKHSPNKSYFAVSPKKKAQNFFKSKSKQNDYHLDLLRD